MLMYYFVIDLIMTPQWKKLVELLTGSSEKVMRIIGEPANGQPQI